MIKRLMVIGAHPDDPELIAGGIASKIKSEIKGSKICFVTTTNGDAGHQTLFGDELAKIRKAETERVASETGFKYIVMNNHDGRLTTDISIREELIGLIRRFMPDLIITHYADDYHPDHRATHTLVNDSIYLLGVPAIAPQVPVLRYMPMVWYELSGNKENKVFCDIEGYISSKAKMSACHESQYFDWLPWIDGDDISKVEQTFESKLNYMTAKMRRFAHNSYLSHKYDAQSFFWKNASLIEAFEICAHANTTDPDIIEYFKNN